MISNEDSLIRIFAIHTFDMKHMKCETDFYRGKLSVVSIRMLELVVLFGISQYRHCIERAFVKWQNQHLSLEL